MTRGIALVRRPSSRLAEGIVTHIARVPVDSALARRQHDAYRAALAGAGWSVREVVPADDCPDSVFVEDTVVVIDAMAVLARPGAVARRPEVAGTERAVRVVRIDPPRSTGPGSSTSGSTTCWCCRCSSTRAARGAGGRLVVVHPAGNSDFADVCDRYLPS